jgi:hypothetical protein
MAIEVEREYIQKWAKVHLPDYKSRIMHQWIISSLQKMIAIFL